MLLPPRVPITRDPDVLVVGAGPSGCATALAYASRGARVLQIEARSEPTLRLAGEWLHPSAVTVLRHLGIDNLSAKPAHPAGSGFAIFPDDGQGPILLNYTNGASGRTCHHMDLVATLRSAAASHPAIHLLPDTRVHRIDGQTVSLSCEKRAEPLTLRAEVIVGADGRSSNTRRFLGVTDDRVLVSYMAGVLLEDAELPFEGFGHVFLGGPGPVFAYRIGSRHVRACLDVPIALRQAMQEPDALRTTYGPALARGLQESFTRALAEGKVQWAANQWRSRANYGRKGLALVGDAVGHFHPLTATGLAMGLRDGWYLAQSKNISDYRSRRSAECHVPGLLAATMYQLFTFDDPGTQALKRGLFEAWRQSSGERHRAMRLIAGQETDAAQFHQAFLKALTRALGRTLRHQVFPMHWRKSASTLCGIGTWLGRLAFLNGQGLATRARPATPGRMPELSPPDVPHHLNGSSSEKGCPDGLPV